MEELDVAMLSFDTDGDFKDNYKFLIGAVLPRPIALVSTRNEDGSNNLAPFSFFTCISARPMVVAFSPMIRSTTGRPKDTPVNVLREKEFVVNIVSESIAEKVNAASAELPYGEDEFIHAGLTPLDSVAVNAARVKESLVHFECRYLDRLDYGGHVGGGQLITGEVVKVHVDESVYDSGRILTDTLLPVGRGSGKDWIRCSDRFELERLTGGLAK